MATLQKRAEGHAERIQYCFDFAGDLGYTRAQYHYVQLIGLAAKAEKADGDEAEVKAIQAMVTRADKLMQQMLEREPEPADSSSS